MVISFTAPCVLFAQVKSKKLAAEIADKTRAEEELQAASREPKGPVENDGRESAGVVGHAGWKEDMRKGMCTTVAEENSGESLRLDSPATTGPGVGVVGKEGARHAETLIAAGNAGGARSEEERHASSASWSAHGVNGQAGGREAPNIAELIGEAGESKPVLTKLRRMFLKRVRKAGDDMESSPAMQLALHCPLSPTSPCLMRDDVLGKGRYGTVTRVLHKFGLFALKEVSAVSCLPFSEVFVVVVVAGFMQSAPKAGYATRFSLNNTDGRESF